MTKTSKHLLSKVQGKLILSVLFLFICTTSLHAQITGQVFSKKSSWSIIKTNLFDETFFEISTYKIEGDTLIEDKNYSKLLKDNKSFSALRETEDHKVYAYFSTPFLYPSRELLIYDFDWYPNKTLYFQMVDFPDEFFIQTVIGNSIDSIQLLDGKYYQCLKNDYEGTWLIRGIGDIKGFFNSTFDLPTNGDQYALLCFFIDDTLIYSNTNFNYCNTNSIDIVTNGDSNIKLYPNPSNGIVTVELPKSQDIDVFKIFDTKGVLVRIYEVRNKDIIEVHNLTKGAYIYSAITKKNQKLSGKIIII